MKIIDKKYYSKFQKILGSKVDELIKSCNFSDEELDLGYVTQASAVFSSNIEGNSIDLNSFMNYKIAKKKLNPQKEILEIENLIKAYEFAQSNRLNENNFLNCHKIFAKTFVSKGNLGKYRSEKVGVFSSSGLVYLALEPEFVNEKMKELFDDIEELLIMNLTNSQVFYYAGTIHLVFAHIHPFRDGNGRAARLLEKWFIAEKLGKDFWMLSLEKYYKEHQQDYYNNINLGVNYYELDYNKCFPFLAMLVDSIKRD